MTFSIGDAGHKVADFADAPTPLCRFEDRLSGRALALHTLLQRIEARQADELDAAFAAINTAQRNGLWVALLLDYSLGEWLDPAQVARHGNDGTPRLTALVFQEASHELPCQ